MTDTIASDAGLSSSSEQILRAIARAMIPPSTGLMLPGADDPQIIADLRRSSTPFHPFLNEALSDFDSRLADETGQRFEELDAAAQLAGITRLREQEPELIALLVSLIVQCYYRDTRVLESLDIPIRPPYPEGYQIATGDWSLLDPVRARGRIWRDA